MSTRAVYTFIDKGFSGKPRAFHIYGHCDGYPDGEHGGIAKIRKAIEFAWELPRFEADEFAAAFVRGNKEDGGGNIRITTDYKKHGDLEFRYEISLKGDKLFVKVFSVLNDWKDDGPAVYTLVQEGPIDEVYAWAMRERK